MSGSINFLFHILGFGIIFTALLGGWIVEQHIRSEKDWSKKTILMNLNRRFGLLSPLASGILLLTGIINIFNVYSGHIALWHTEGWLVAKIILFAFLLVNGAVFGPILVRRRMKSLKSILENSPTEDAESTFKILSKSISTFYLVQFLLLLIILFLSIAGTGKHPGAL